MNQINRTIFGLLISTLISISGIRLTSAYFSHTGSSTGNTFTASNIFPTKEITPIPGGIADHIVISEVQINGGSGQADHDFIELYNPTDSTIDLNNHRLVKRTGSSSTDTNIKSWTTSTIIPARGYYLWANSIDASSRFIALADTTTTVSLTSNNSIALRSGDIDTGLIIDSVSWNTGSTLGEGSPFAPIPTADQSIERKATATSTSTTLEISGIDEFNGNGYDTGNNLTDFTLRSTPQPQNSLSLSEPL